MGLIDFIIGLNSASTTAVVEPEEDYTMLWDSNEELLWDDTNPVEWDDTVWILEGGTWNDSGIWSDLEIWIDS